VRHTRSAISISILVTAGLDGHGCRLKEPTIGYCTQRLSNAIEVARLAFGVATRDTRSGRPLNPTSLRQLPRRLIGVTHSRTLSVIYSRAI